MKQLLIVMVMFVAGCAARKQSAEVPKPAASMAKYPPDARASGVPCSDYQPLPEGWVCGTGGTVVCDDGWHFNGPIWCVKDEKKP